MKCFYERVLVPQQLSIIGNHVPEPPGSCSFALCAYSLSCELEFLLAMRAARRVKMDPSNLQYTRNRAYGRRVRKPRDGPLALGQPLFVFIAQ